MRGWGLGVVSYGMNSGELDGLYSYGLAGDKKSNEVGFQCQGKFMGIIGFHYCGPKGWVAGSCTTCSFQVLNLCASC